MSVAQPHRATVDQHLALAEKKLARLRALTPILLDVSLREPCFAAPIGHTLQNKLDLLRLVDEFGVQDKIIATLDYQFAQHPQVEDDFCRHLQQHGYDRRRCYAMTAIGTHAAGAFVPGAGMCKLVEYGIPNTILELELLPRHSDPDQMWADLAASAAWLRARLAPVDGKPGRILVNIVDLVDTFMQERDLACAALALLATLALDGVSFEDDRGTYFPFQVGAVAAAAKAMLRADQQVLCHVHTGNGMENASVIEALLQGADGYWGGLERTSSTIGHASLGELIANLTRAGNRHMGRQYRMERLAPICAEMHEINTGAPVPDNWPIFGASAYRSVLSDFDQCSERAMDLAPEAIGARYLHRVAPVGSDIPVLQARVWEALQITIDADMARKMILLMRADLRENRRIVYDEVPQLRELHRRASAA
ncbi:hypothetical protein [Massilia sp. CF038]|uniref:hypothetical protein n=1 Tax=Massilia sp. CF038 TaxID=1881045 RepID=UPI000913A57E|nr:hypothetical protein [Massilia sp. CF038]SHH10328.1 HMGL-like [Massilia sp. CF038]